MSINNKLTIWIAAAGALLISSLVTTAARADTLPDITDASVPQFSNNVKVRANRGTWTITGTRDFTFDDGTNDIWSGTGNYKLVANFDSNGDFVDGTVSLGGKIPGLYSGNVNDLVTADLSFFQVSPEDVSLIGWNTTNIVCSPLLGVNCTTNESVIVYLDNGFSGDVLARFRTTGLAVTSVPLPAAVWLFGAGIGMLAAAGRKRKQG